MLEDIALMRALPGMRVLVPADHAAARAAIKLAARTSGPVYVRMGRAAVPCVYAQDVELEIGRAYVLREGADVTLIACGVEIEEALKAADVLAAEGVSTEVVDAFSVKPLDAGTILASVGKTGWLGGCRFASAGRRASGSLRMRGRARSLRQVRRVRGVDERIRSGRAGAGGSSAARAGAQAFLITAKIDKLTTAR